MHVELEWDDSAYLLAILKNIKGKRTHEIRRQLIAAMRSYDGNSCGNLVTMSPDIKARVAHWVRKLKDVK